MKHRWMMIGWLSDEVISLVPFSARTADRTQVRQLPLGVLNYRWCFRCHKWIKPGRKRIGVCCAHHFFTDYAVIWKRSNSNVG